MCKCPYCGAEIDDVSAKIIARSNDSNVIVDGCAIIIPGYERVIFIAILEQYPKVVSYEQIISILWGSDPNGGPLNVKNVIGQYICRLRKRLKGSIVSIKTEYDVGIRLVFEKGETPVRIWAA